jgi:L-2-hydroxyglutarate oxidase LhgO
MQALDFDVAVIGAGVVGAAVARRLSLAGRSVLLLERHGHPASEVSARNSGVIHAGLYYPTGSAKARFCVTGRRMLTAYLTERGLPHRICGKFVVATSDAERERLDAIAARAAANGVEGLRFLDGAEIAREEPAVRAVAAIHSTVTGTVDVAALVAAFIADAESAGATVVLRAPVTGLRPRVDGWTVAVGGEHDTAISVAAVVVAAGLGTDALTGLIEGYPPAARRPLHLAKGHYYRLRGRSPFRRHIYPVPVPGGLGTHATVDLDGAVRFGPDVEWVDEIDYRFTSDRRPLFVESIRRWFPAATVDDLEEDYTGIRPKIAARGAPDEDFRIDAAAHHGLAGLVVLQGIESPGLTSAMALAEAVAGAL